MLNTDAYADNHLTCHKHIPYLYPQAIRLWLASGLLLNSRECHFHCDTLYLSDIAYGALGN